MFKLIKIRALVALTLFLLVFFAHAIETVKLTDDSTNLNISSTLAVYPQEGRAVSFDEFKLSRTNLSYQNYKIPNYGFNPAGVWLYGEVANFSKGNNWVLNVNFSQLDQVDFYLVSNGEVLDAVSGGRDQSKHFYRTPTFSVTLDTEHTYQLYLFVKAKRIPIIAPVRIMSEQQHQQETLLDYLIRRSACHCALLHRCLVRQRGSQRVCAIYPRLSRISLADGMEWACSTSAKTMARVEHFPQSRSFITFSLRFCDLIHSHLFTKTQDV